MNNFKWQKLGLVIEPNPSIDWLHSWVSASCAYPDEKQGVFRIYATGKDEMNRSRIGTFLLDLATMKISDLIEDAVVAIGERGTFDENGTGYPFVMKYHNEFYLFYLGWIRGVHVPWYNGLFLAKSEDGITFEKVSKAPIFDRDEDDYLGIGSMCIMEENNAYKMWYSRFESWGSSEDDHKHFYNIKYAESVDCRNWIREKEVCIDFIDKQSEYAIARPTVIKLEDKYYMWYSHRGDSYKIGFAISDDGKKWRRLDALCGLEYAKEGWDSTMQCYPFVFRNDDDLYMLYNGNNYGETGLGIATCKVDDFLKTFKSL
jgi:hypothetical protein